MKKIEGQKQAKKVLLANQSPRYIHLDKLEKYYRTQQYDTNTNDWFASGKPLWERRPCIAYPIVRNAITANIDLCLGKTRFNGFALGGDVGEFLEQDRAIEALQKQVRFTRLSREVLQMAQTAKSVAVHFYKKGGRLKAQTFKSKWCEPKFTDEGDVESLDVRYCYIDYVPIPEGLKAEVRWFRRVIDGTHDIRYNPVAANKNGTEPSWSIASKSAHGLGFCPVVWYAHMQECTAVNEYDGVAIHEDTLDEIECHDRIVSQRHRVAIYSEPQPWETGVGLDDGATSGAARDAVPGTASGGAVDLFDNRATSTYESCSGPGVVRMKGPGSIWKYANPLAKVGVLTVPTGAIEAIDTDARDLRMKISEALGVVFLDPNDIKFISTVSGKALAVLRQRQTDRCDQIRDDFGDNFMIPALLMLVRLAQVCGIELKTKEYSLEGIADLNLAPKWGSYYDAEPSETEMIVRTLAQAKESEIIDQDTAVRAGADIWPAQDIEARKKQIETEIEKRDKREADRAVAIAGAKREERGNGQEVERPRKPSVEQAQRPSSPKKPAGAPKTPKQKGRVSGR